MIIVMNPEANKQDIKRIITLIKKKGLSPHLSVGKERKLVMVIGDERKLNIDFLLSMSGVEKVLPILKPYKLASREFHKKDTIVKVGNVEIGGREVIFIAGPCAVESEKQMIEVAFAVKKAGAKILRGGAFKPRTSPYSFQGLGEKGLKILKKAGKETDLPTVTEVVDPADVNIVSRYVDMLQIGTRNMQNFNLLRAVGKIGKPVLLKRGMNARLDEFLMSAEYILAEGNSKVVLCERGIRTFTEYTRNTLDLNIVPFLKKETHLPVIVDPSHGTGVREIVRPMARAAIAAGADGLIVEVHPQPNKSVSDASQTISPDDFAILVSESKAIAQAIARE